MPRQKEKENNNVTRSGPEWKRNTYVTIDDYYFSRLISNISKMEINYLILISALTVMAFFLL